MREILFRGKCKSTGEWIEGQYILVDPVDIPKSIREPKAVIFPAKAECNWFNKYFYTARDVIPETVGQYTGLEDKNGKKVFEGDILQKYSPYLARATLLADGRIEITRKTELILISYEVTSFMYSKPGSDYKDPLDDNEYGEDLSYYEIIGNIHDNPELLKGETK